MVMVKDEKQVNVGQPVLYNNELGVLESVYEDKVNVRINASKELHTVPASELTQASPEEMKKYEQSQGKDVLLNQARNLKKELMNYDLWLEVKQATDAQVKAHREEKEKGAAASNIGPSGNIVTEVKQEPLEVDKEKEGRESYQAGTRAAEREQQQSPAGQRERHEQVAAGMAGITQKQGERSPETEQEKQDAEERERQRKAKELEERVNQVKESNKQENK